MFTCETYYLMLENGERFDLEDDYEFDTLGIAIHQAQMKMKDKDCDARLMIRHPSGYDRELLTIRAGGEILADDVWFHAQYQGKMENIQFENVYDALDYAEKWMDIAIAAGPNDYRAEITAKWTGQDNITRMDHVWVYENPEFKTMYYTVDDGAHWAGLMYVPNISANLFWCLIAFDRRNGTVYSQYVRPEDLSLKPAGDLDFDQEIWNDQTRYEDMIAKNIRNNLARHMIDIGLSLRESIVITAGYYLSGTNEIADFMSRFLGYQVLPQTVSRAKKDASEKIDAYNIHIKARHDAEDSVNASDETVEG